MSLDARQTSSPVLRSRSELEAMFRSAERRDGTGLIGIEHEKLLFPAGATGAVSYEGPHGIGALLSAYQRAEGWEPFREAPGLPVIALTQGPATISLEPGGQFEWSGSPHLTVRQAHDENAEHVERLKVVARGLGLNVVALGYRPFNTVSSMPWMPKSRYATMRTTLGTAGSHALDMMLMTATAQVSIDWRDEEDCARKVTAAARLSPVTVALFANSSIVNGAVSGFESFRSRVWNDVDAARCGVPDFLVDGNFSYSKYLDWALAAPMLFLRRDGRYLTPRCTFGHYLANGFENHRATESDWVDHLSTLFPEVRIKRVLEVRSADANGVAMTSALAAYVRGLLYDRTATAGVLSLLQSTPDQHRALHRAAQKQGLAAENGRLLGLARDCVTLAREGLRRLDPGDLSLLEPLEAVVASGRSPSVRVRELFAARTSDASFLDAFAV